MPPPVFCEKSPQSIENKGREVAKETQESSRARKRLEIKEIEKIQDGRATQAGFCGRV
jgi:hypothetical protein